MEKKVLVSACLLGRNCRFDGENCLDRKLIKFLKENNIEAIGVCPEELGGLRGRRGPFEFKGSALSVIRKRAEVKDFQGRIYTKNFLKGAYKTLMITKKNKIIYAILKSKSPSCSPDFIYDGSFKGILKKGLGIAAYILKKNGIKIFSEKSLY